MAKAKAIKKKASTEVGFAKDLHADSGMGMEGADKDSFAIPYLGILQPLSPQVDEDDGTFIKGAKPGMIFNSVTGELYKNGVTVLPVAYKREIIEWVPRDDGGGLVARYEVGEEPSSQVDAKGRRKTEDGNDLADTRLHYVLILKKHGEFEPAVMSLASSQIKKSKRWMTMMQNFKIEQDGQRFTPPTFAVKYNLTTVKEENDKGKWHGWVITLESQLSDEEMELYAASKDFHKAILSGEVKTVDPEQEEKENF